MAHHRRLVSAIALCLGLLAGPVGAQERALTREAADHLRHGHVTAAIALFDGAAQGKPLTEVAWSRVDAPLLARALVRQGRYADAQRVLAPGLADKHPTLPHLLTALDIEAITGTPQSRLALARTALVAHPGVPQIVVAHGQALYESGKAREARKLLDVLADRYQNNEFSAPADLVAVAESLRLNGYARDANRVLDEAAQVANDETEKLDVELAWGLLFLSKYNYRDADKSLRAVLAIDPHHPAALVGMARVDLKSDQDVAKARKRLDALLAENRRDVAALTLRAEVALHDEDYATADVYLREAAAVQPTNLDVLAVRGAWCQMTDNAACWADVDKTAKKLRPDDGRVWLKTAEYLEMGHRYRETIEVLQTAIKQQPELWSAHAALGMGYARLVDDAKARQHLETAFSGDPFDVRTANQLNVLYDSVLKQMVTLPGRKADLRVHRNDRKGYEREMLPFLQEALDALDVKYAYAAQRPIQVEVFPQTEQFSVRTVGLPQLGAHAVCFGHLVTSRSPGEKPFNWKMVLWHELSHIYHIQMTDGRVPRWLTEGLAMMESAWANPRWTMRMDRRAYDRLHAGQLAKVATFNLAFSQAQTMQDIIDAYYQAMLLTSYLSDTYGFAKLRELVVGHKTGATTEALVTRILGTTATDLDVGFAAWLGKKLARFDRDFRPYLPTLVKQFGTPEKAPTPPADADAEEGDGAAAESEKPTEVHLAGDVTSAQDVTRALTATLTALLGAQRGVTNKRAVQAVAADLVALSKQAAEDPQARTLLCTVRFVVMEALAGSGDLAGATAQAQALVDVPGGACDGVKQRAVLAMAHKGDADQTLFWTHALAAQALDPTDASVAALVVEPTEKLHKLLVAGGDSAKAAWVDVAAPGRTRTAVRARLLPVVALEPNEPQFAFLLGRLAWEDWQAAKTDTEKQEALADLTLATTAMRECIPGTRTALLHEARQLHASGQTLPALGPYRMAAEKATTAKDRAEIWCELADITAQSGPKDDAAEARRRCLAERPAPSP